MVSLPVDLSQFQLDGFSYPHGSVGQRSVPLRLTPLSSGEDSVHPSAKREAADKCKHILKMWEIPEPSHVFQKRQNAFWRIIVDLMLEGKFVKDWKHQNN